jgi:uncharacterized membrane protein
MVMGARRVLTHLFYLPWWVRRRFPKRTLTAIEHAIHDAEKTHTGEIRFAVEGSLGIELLLRSVTARHRAVEVFSQLRVWDTEHNSGVLIYLLLADHDVEIVVDRGIHAKVQAEEWQRICHVMEQAFKRGDFEGGTVAGIRAVGQQLAKHFPGDAAGRNELPDRPVLL